MDNQMLPTLEVEELAATPRPVSPSASGGAAADKPSVNFGDGIELLMNDKRKGDKSPRGEPTSIESLETELNALGDVSRKSSKTGLFNEMLSRGATPVPDQGREPPAIGGAPSEGTSNASVGFAQTPSPHAAKAHADAASSVGGDNGTPHSGIGAATAAASVPKQDGGWSAFDTLGSLPVDGDVGAREEEPKKTEAELLREKFRVLRDLEQLERKGVTLSKRYTMESSLLEMKGEYETIVAEREKKASAKFQGRMLMAAVTGLEFLNNRFDPFDVKLDGWAEQIGESMDDYDEIFGELHEKYKSKARMAPELKLLFQLGGSAMMVHMTNTMFKSSLPGMDDIMRQNPELMQQFTQAAADSVSGTHPGLGGFLGEFGGQRRAPPPNVATGPPPPPMKASPPPRSQRPVERPDIGAARGTSVERSQARAPRPEMRGPRDVRDLLAGLKTKNIDVPAPKNQRDDDASTVSVQELKAMSAEAAPPRSKRRNGGSSRNVVALNLQL